MMNEELSALVDGELEGAKFDAHMAILKNSEEARAAWLTRLQSLGQRS